MRDFIFPVRHDSDLGLQAQLRRQLIDAIIDGRLSGSDPLPSCRRLAQSLGVSRNTVVLAYQALADEGLLVSRERVGYFVNTDMVFQQTETKAGFPEPEAGQSVDWWHRLRLRPSELVHVEKPRNWRRYPYPFIYGQPDPNLFPVSTWRMCSRQALGVEAIQKWTEDNFNEDDSRLIEEIRTRVLPRRGIKAAPSEILITLGAQNALFLIAELLAGPGRTLAVENPGYVDTRNIFALNGTQVRPIPVDQEGIVVDHRLDGCACAYVTPSHQSPTTVTLPLERRMALLERAQKSDFLVIEDDYEAEANFLHAPTTALKAMDRSGRVIYIGSFSKYLGPGLRMGYMVGAEEFIHEARMLRRLMLRHPATNNQRTMALFIAGGHYDALVHRLQRDFRTRWEIMGEGLSKYLPQFAPRPSCGGTSFWLEGPRSLDTDVLAREALGEGIVIEPGSLHFLSKKPPRNFMRLGFSSVKPDSILPGLQALRGLIDRRPGGDQLHRV
ncbi:PLP-dependent aminotransferase family protein [Pelagibius sp.]|uniref:MocR-like pyridoxine biosynthesis transcription factor PdxR n=1 Tax=Pelagibius sp. TaxID=1931238 RepID=UPI002628D562|nr:PLP-dependent aminotransferase family protein [Pelagibius sp.]